MLDAEARMLLDLMEKAVQDGRPHLNTLPYAVGRQAADKMSEDSEADPPQIGETVDGDFAGPGGKIRFRRYRPQGAAAGPLPTLIYYHGGGFVIGNIETHNSTCRRLANKSRCQVISIDYRLSPEHPFPAPTDDGVAAFRHIRDNAAPSAPMPSASPSAAIRRVAPSPPWSARCCATREGPRLPDADLSRHNSSKQSASRVAFAEGYFLTKDLMDWFWKAYVPAGTDLADLRLSPLLAKDLKGLPPAFVLTAGYDPLRDEGRAYADRLIEAGIKTTYVNYPGTIHGFFSLTRFLSQGLKANDEAAAVMGAHFGT